MIEGLKIIFENALINPLPWSLNDPMFYIASLQRGWIYLQLGLGVLTAIYSICLGIIRFVRSCRLGVKDRFGLHLKEEPFDTLCLRYKYSMQEAESDFYHRKEYKKQYALRGFRLEYEAKKIPAENLQEVCDAKRANEALLQKIEKEFAKELCGESPCLFDLYGYVLRYGNEEHSLEFDEEFTFRLDGKSEIERWLARQEKIENFQGYTIAVRGIDENTADMLLSMKSDKAYEVSALVIPNASEDELCKMSLKELERFADIKNCKFKLSNENALYRKCYFEFSENEGYAKTDMEEKARNFAERKGFLFKVEKEHFAKQGVNIEDVMEEITQLPKVGKEK